MAAALLRGLVLLVCNKKNVWHMVEVGAVGEVYFLLSGLVFLCLLCFVVIGAVHSRAGAYAYTSSIRCHKAYTCLPCIQSVAFVEVRRRGEAAAPVIKRAASFY